MSESSPKSISPRDLFNLRQQTRVKVIDVRFPKAYEKFRAKWCKNMPLYRALPDTLAEEVKFGETLYIICKNGSVGRRLVETYSDLFKTQNRELVYVEGGLNAWDKEGLPTVRKHSRWSRPEFQCGFLTWFTIILLVVLASVFHRGFLGLASFIMAGLVYFATISEATPLTDLIARMPWNRSKLTQQPATHEIPQD